VKHSPYTGKFGDYFSYLRLLDAELFRGLIIERAGGLELVSLLKLLKGSSGFVTQNAISRPGIIAFIF
jgi:hypothetical protein